jgi:hypothetical protein
MDLFEQPAMSYTSLRQETAIQSGLGQKAAFYTVAAMTCQYLYAMNGFDGVIRSADSVTETIKADCGDTRTTRSWTKPAKDWAVKLRKEFGKGRNDDTCRGIVKAIRDASDTKAAFYMLATSIDAGHQSISGLKRYLGDEAEHAAETAKVEADAAEAERKAIAADAAEADGDTEAEAERKAEAEAKLAESKAEAVAAIVAGIGRRGQDLGFESADYAAIVAALLPHIHGQHLADTITAAQVYAIDEADMAAAA